MTDEVQNDREGSIDSAQMTIEALPDPDRVGRLIAVAGSLSHQLARSLENGPLSKLLNEILRRMTGEK